MNNNVIVRNKLNLAPPVLNEWPNSTNQPDLFWWFFFKIIISYINHLKYAPCAGNNHFRKKIKENNTHIPLTLCTCSLIRCQLLRIYDWICNEFCNIWNSVLFIN